MNERKICLTMLGLSLAVAATAVLAADVAQPEKTKLSPADAAKKLECTEAEFNFAKRAGKTLEACNDEKARKALVPAVKGIDKTAAPPARF
jgi:hypothetical protein